MHKANMTCSAKRSTPNFGTSVNLPNNCFSLVVEVAFKDCGLIGARSLNLTGNKYVAEMMCANFASSGPDSIANFSVTGD